MKAAVMGYGTIGSGVVEVLDINVKQHSKTCRRAGRDQICIGFKRFSGRSDPG